MENLRVIVSPGATEACAVCQPIAAPTLSMPVPLNSAPLVTAKKAVLTETALLRLSKAMLPLKPCEISKTVNRSFQMVQTLSGYSAEKKLNLNEKPIALVG